MNAHGVAREGSQGTPQVRVFGRGVLRNLQFEVAPSPGFDQSQNWNQQRARPNENELQHFIEDSGAQAAQGNVDGHGE